MVIFHGLARILMCLGAVAIFAARALAADQPAAPAANVEPAASTGKYEDLVNFSLLDHTLSLTSIRSGNQDSSGTNQYYFTTQLIGAVGSMSDAKSEESVLGEEQTIGALELKALTHWEANPKEGRQVVTEITGDELRNLTSQVMQKFSVDERNVFVGVQVRLYESNKKFRFFGDDILVAKVVYFPIPKRGAFSKMRQDELLTLTDGKSTFVTLATKYKSPLVDSSKAPNAKPVN
jgi:hypothetical protein